MFKMLKNLLRLLKYERVQICELNSFILVKPFSQQSTNFS